MDNIKDYYRSLIERNIIVSGKHFNEKKIRNFKEYSDWKLALDKNKFVYDIIFNIIDTPSCKMCDNLVKLKDFKTGYRKYCSNACLNKSNSESEIFSNKISNGMKQKFDEQYFLNKYEFVISKEGENFTISNYCKHGNFTINKNRFMRLMQNNNEICENCIYENIHLIHDTNINKYSNETGYKHAMPDKWNAINDNCIVSDSTFSEKKYMYKMGIMDRPICPICKIRSCKYISTFSGYTKTCVNNSCIKSSSAPEQEIYTIIKKMYPDTISRYKINSEEIDIFIPSLNIGIEFNGLYWHSEKFRNYNWHLKKMIKLRDLGYSIFTIWEDDWKNKRDILLSQLHNLLNKSNRIFARNTRICIIEKHIADNFLDSNHLQGKCTSLHRFGLFFNDELISVMTFGKSRMIFHNKTDRESFELLRFCTKQNFIVIGGASKLMSYFVSNINPNMIVSYANYDFSDGNVYTKLGFSKIDKIYPGYWWCKDGEKYHRSNFMKHKIVLTEEDKLKTAPQIMKELGYYRVWNSGNLKFVKEFN